MKRRDDDSLEKCCWPFETRWRCHGNEIPQCSDEVGAVGTPPDLRWGKAAARNVSGRQTSLHLQSCGLRHDGYSVLWAGETRFFISSHQNTAKRRSSSGAGLLMKTAVWVPTRCWFCSTGEGALTRERHRKRSWSGRTWSTSRSTPKLCVLGGVHVAGRTSSDWPKHGKCGLKHNQTFKKRPQARISRIPEL